MTVRCQDAAARGEHSRPAILLSMEPHPPDRGPGRNIFLSGASSSGRSMLAKAMQEALPEPFPHVSSDHLVASGMLPARRDPDGPFAWWQQMRPRFFDGFHRCLPALAAAGNDLIVEHITEFRAWREYLAMLLDGLDVFLVGVHCEPAEIDRRERDRGDRRIGEGRSHVETDLIHTFGPYDFEVDTTNAGPRAVAASVLAAWRAGTRRRALQQGISDSRGTLSGTCRYRHSSRQKRMVVLFAADGHP
jgi:chloramphenicol 3-O phosphotransferase